uniref:Receptor protein-tyrosine kinase n=1 Tax=Scleropages formosus TaxID=113540 RepID=A0A8C9VK47_SCLFO
DWPLMCSRWLSIFCDRVCLGTDMKLALPSSLENHHRILKLLYTGCQVVHGNLEITHLHGTPDLSFLQDIAEVQGYVLISHVSVDVIPLDNLRIIRGSQLYNSSYALAVLDNTVKSAGGPGLRELRMKSLTEILLGGVYIWGNPQLCFPNPQRMQWSDVLDEQNPQKVLHLQPLFVATHAVLLCAVTHLQCASGCLRCKGPHPNDCCHKQCAAGCTGPKDTDCLACRHFNDNGVCKDNCPSANIYDPVTFQLKPNKNKKFSFGATCVKECPRNYLAMEMACTMVCPNSNQEVIVTDTEGNMTNKCEKCDGDCPKVCYGLGMDSLQGVLAINSSNIGLFDGCKKIFGSLAFLPQTFTGDPLRNISALDPNQLGVFRSLREITGYLYIEAWPETWRNLSVFENLEFIRGRMLYRGVFSLGVQSLNVESLGLRSLRNVAGGLILIHNNSRLCYTSSLPWKALLPPDRSAQFIVTANRSPQDCGTTTVLPCLRVCLCGSPPPGTAGSVVVRGHSTTSDRCVTLTPERSPCPWQGAHQCRECLRFQDGDVCVSRCPSGVKEDQYTVWKYPDATGRCLPCEVNFILFLILVAILVFYLRRQKHMKRKETLRRILQEHELVEPLTPSGAVPNQAQMRILKETELKKVRVLGSGAFGTVYKGVWTPDGENVKIPVAIKVLLENTSPKANKDILDEAYVMAGVASPYVCRLLGICLTSTVQLVTQLMPYGCLLDYVRENKDRIGSQYLLNWCVQIAKGMSYLEDVRLVHRDLAARNVLVKNPNHVKITDFGLARLLDVDKTEYHADGGKVPIKWMALESILHRKFTHQSDVWSYGVTVWELMTFGAKPYDQIPARDIPELLEQGERLPQPLICTIDVYMIMVKCWMIDPESRPRFRELVTEFSTMARDPSRYVVIQVSALTVHFFRTLLEEEGAGMQELLDADKYLVPQPSFPGPQMSNGSFGHHSYRVRAPAAAGTLVPIARSRVRRRKSQREGGACTHRPVPLGGVSSPPYLWEARRAALGRPRYRPCPAACPSVPPEDTRTRCSWTRRWTAVRPPPGATARTRRWAALEAPRVTDGTADRPCTLPRKSTSGVRRPHNGLRCGNSVENPEYVVPLGSTSPAFDNPYYLDLASAAHPPRLANGFVTPTAENPEYLGLADTWSGRAERTRGRDA